MTNRKNLVEKMDSLRVNVINLTLPLPVTKGLDKDALIAALNEWQGVGYLLGCYLDGHGICVAVELNPCRHDQRAMWAALHHDPTGIVAGVTGAYYQTSDMEAVDEKVKAFLDAKGIAHVRQ